MISFALVLSGTDQLEHSVAVPITFGVGSLEDLLVWHSVGLYPVNRNFQLLWMSVNIKQNSSQLADFQIGRKLY